MFEQKCGEIGIYFFTFEHFNKGKLNNSLFWLG